MFDQSILVTGASGFVGGFLLEALCTAEFRNIKALHRRPLADAVLSRYGDSVRWIQADLSTDDLAPVLEDVHTVFHLAAYSSILESPQEQDLLHRYNVESTQRLMDACRAGGVSHCIFVSSIAACESSPDKVVTETNGLPVSTYGKTKKQAEDILMSGSSDTFKVTVLRPTALFGEHHEGSVYEFVRAIEKGRFVLFGKASNRTNFYYVRDFIDVLLNVMNNPKAHGRVWIAADDPCSMNDLAIHVQEALGQTKRIPRIPRAFGKVLSILCDGVTAITGKSLPLSSRRFRAMTRDVVYSNQEISRALGRLRPFGLKEGLKRTIQWYRKAGLLPPP